MIATHTTETLPAANASAVILSGDELIDTTIHPRRRYTLQLVRRHPVYVVRVIDIEINRCVREKEEFSETLAWCEMMRLERVPNPEAA